MDKSISVLYQVLTSLFCLDREMMSVKFKVES
jgi:hypothetical protein